MKALGILFVIIGVIAGLVGYSQRLPGGDEEIDRRTAEEINRLNGQAEAVLKVARIDNPNGALPTYTAPDNKAYRDWQAAKNQREQTMLVSYIAGGVFLLVGLLIAKAAESRTKTGNIA